MTQNAIVTDLNLCVGCLACAVACKAVNNVPVGNFWNKVLRIGPNKAADENAMPEMYFLPVTCQHYKDPACVQVCPTEASYKAEDGTVQVNKEKCIGCQFCAMACPYGVRYLNEEERVVEKCTLCEQKTAQGELPQCVAQCAGRARYFGDIEKGIENMEGAGNHHSQSDPSYGSAVANRVKLGEYVEAFTDADVHYLPNVGNNPSCAYILRNRTWHS